MPIDNLRDIRTNVRQYLDDKVTVTATITALVGEVISPNENFKIQITARNSPAAAGGIALMNVRWYIRSSNGSIARLIVPPVSIGVARTGYHETSRVLPPGDEVTSMYIFPPNSWANYLSVGDTDNLGDPGNKGIEGKALAGGVSNISTRIYADIDMDYLFPTKNRSSDTATPAVNVID